jgi:hypothetical protein
VVEEKGVDVCRIQVAYDKVQWRAGFREDNAELPGSIKIISW